MPQKFTEKLVSYFVFSVPTTQGTAHGGLGEVINDMLREGIGHPLHVCRRTKDQGLLRAEGSRSLSGIRLQRKIRVRQRTALILSGEDQTVVGTVNKWAISGEVLASLIYFGPGKALVFRTG